MDALHLTFQLKLILLEMRGVVGDPQHDLLRRDKPLPTKALLEPRQEELQLCIIGPNPERLDARVFKKGVEEGVGACQC